MEQLNKYFSGILLPVFLIIIGLYFAFRLKFFYILHPVKAVKSMLKNKNGGFKSLSVALAGTLGIGNIVGVSSAILAGGAGSIFWMWISAFCAMSLKYVEVFLAMRFRCYKDNKPYGGAPYYINKGLKKKIGEKTAFFLSSIFAILCVLNSLSTGNLVQINSVSSIIPSHKLIFGIIFTIVVFIIISGGLKRIEKITSALIPILTIIYVLFSLYIILINFYELQYVFRAIFHEAFSPKSAISGFCGYGIGAAIRYGVNRGILSNEAGCGTSPCAHASALSTNEHSQGCLGIFEVFVDTILLCTLTAIVILLSNIHVASNATELVLNSFEKFTGKIGYYTIIALSILFALATVICQYFYGAESLNYISKSKKARTVFTFIFCLVLLIGSVIPMSIMWQISDLIIALMTIFNIICLFALRKNIQK